MIALMDPTACATRVRQRNGDDLRTGALDLVLASDQRLQWQTRKKALDRETADGDDKPRAQKAELVVEPTGAGSAFGGRGHAITATTWARTGITARDCRDVDSLARCRFVETDALEPAEERLSGTAGEGAAARALDLPRRLANEHDTRSASERDDRSHVFAMSATLAGSERMAVRLERAIEVGAPHLATPSAASPNDWANA